MGNSPHFPLKSFKKRVEILRKKSTFYHFPKEISFLLDLGSFPSFPLKSFNNRGEVPQQKIHFFPKKFLFFVFGALPIFSFKII